MLIGFCGYARSGKDTGAELIGFETRSFAHALKQEMADFIYQRYGIDVFNCSAEEKDIIRPLLVAHGAGMRKINPMYWVEKVFPNSFCVRGNLSITDVRYLNEAKRIHELGGHIFHLITTGVGPANDEEERSIGEIMAHKRELRHVYIYNEPAKGKDIYRQVLQEEIRHARR